MGSKRLNKSPRKKNSLLLSSFVSSPLLSSRFAHLRLSSFPIPSLHFSNSRVRKFLSLTLVGGLACWFLCRGVLQMLWNCLSVCSNGKQFCNIVPASVVTIVIRHILTKQICNNVSASVASYQRSKKKQNQLVTSCFWETGEILPSFGIANYLTYNSQWSGRTYKM